MMLPCMWRIVMNVDAACGRVSCGSEFKKQLLFLRCNDGRSNIFSSL